MDPSNREFMNMLQSSQNQNSPNATQSSPPMHQSQFPHYLAPNFQNMNPFGPASNFPPYGHSPPGFHGVPQQGNLSQSTPIRFQGFASQDSWQHSPNQVFGVAANTSSHGSKTTSSCPAAEQQEQPVNIEDSSNSSDEGGRKGTRRNWTEEENKDLADAWVRNSTDPIKGTDQKSEYYWKAVAADFNSGRPSNLKGTPLQCKTHWGGVKRDVAKFCGVYAKVRSTYCSGQSDDMVMEKAHRWYKEQNQQRLFTLEYLWRDLKDLPKWRRLIQVEEIKNKRTKISESGAYTSSSNQDTDGETVSKEKRLEGQKKAKEKLKGKGKGVASPLGDQPTQNMVLYHEAASIKAAATIKAAEATAKSAEAKKEQARIMKYETYMKLVEKDTSGYSEPKLKRHEAILDQLAKELTETACADE